jgi:hypothetical protein
MSSFHFKLSSMIFAVSLRNIGLLTETPQQHVFHSASFLGQTTSFETEVQEREPWDFYEWITCNEKPRCAPNIFPIMAGNINR